MWVLCACVFIAAIMTIQVPTWGFFAQSALDWEKLIKQNQAHAKARRVKIVQYTEKFILECEEWDREATARWRKNSHKCWAQVPQRLHAYYREMGSE